ncbi:hypothetical protein FHW96_005218 [Novosphingobium sp. SG751A]|uniref:hypothetical protein n=1 Tax=Novosphingobium sp. SG751A TaxID=2587000 RepID=UPI0015539315|nr:hypothetical protein [Novosphingobium sp. SG751A]NOW49027.1 hypothetical protein [Novosphingobium sp. SG751A]
MTQDLALIVNQAVQVKGLIFGLPHSNTYAVAHKYRDLISKKIGECNLVSLNDNSEVVQEILKKTDIPLVLLTDLPNSEIVEFTRKSSFPLIPVSTDFDASCHEYMKIHGVAMIDAVRTVAMAQVGCWQLLAMDRSIKPFPDAGPDQSGGVISDVSDAVPAGVAEIITLPSLHEIRGRQSDLATSLAIAQLAHFYNAARMETATKLSLPLQVFTNGSPPFAQTDGKFDLVGPARCLTFGPFLYLPVGRWQVVFEFETSGSLTTNSFRFDVIADGKVATKDIVHINQSGKFCFSDTFEIHRPWLPVEFRTFLDKGAIEGHFTLSAVTIDLLSAG